MKQYLKMKDSGIEWIGEIPEHWKVKRLKYLAKIETGDKDAIDSDNEGKYPFFVRSQQIEKISTFSCDQEAILTAGDGDIGKIFHYIIGKFDFHQRVYKISDFVEIKGKYLYYYMSENFHKEVVKLSAKTTVDSLRRPMFLNFPVVFGNVDEQQQIMDFLDKQTSKIDSEIENNQKLVELLKEKYQSTIDQAVTKGFNLSVPMKESEIDQFGKIPVHWKISKLKNISEKIIDGEHISPIFTEEGIPYLSSRHIKDEISFDNCKFIDEKTYEDLSRRCNPQFNDVLITVKGTIGTCKRVDIKKKFLMDRNVGMIKPRDILIDSIFLEKILNSTIMQNQIDTLVDTSVIASLYLKEIRNIRIPLPPLEEQKDIVNRLQRKIVLLKNVIKNTGSQIQKLQEYRQTLISATISGKIDVRQKVISQ